MAVCPQVKALYEETIKTFTFRESDGVTIPKSVREEAYTLAVDIVIVSTARETYKNYTVTPAEGFYGNATLVMQDMCEIKIPIKMPRQRLYYGRVPEAFAIWQSLVDWSYFQSYMIAIGESLVSLGTALGASFVPSVNCCSLPDRSWVELPLREVYFKVPFGTQYKIEVSWYKALQIEDGCGNIRNPKSKMADGDKDNGLPPFGTQPSVAPNPNNPFSGLPPASTDEEQALFRNDKIGGLDSTDTDNIPIPESWGYFVEARYANVSTNPNYGACSPYQGAKYALINSAESVTVVQSGLSIVECGIQKYNWTVIGSISGNLFILGLPSAPSLSVVRSPSLPAEYPI